MLYPLLEERKLILEKLRKEIKKDIDSSPEGKLHIAQSKNRIEFYNRQLPGETPGKYIPTKKRQFAARLAQKEYEENLLAEIDANLNLITKSFQGRLDELIGGGRKYGAHRHPSIRQLIHKVYPDQDEYIQQWQAVKYEGLPFDEDDKSEFITKRGERVRSKSEVLIADMLYDMGIPYRYEYPVDVDELGTCRPDFVCLNVRTRKEFIWEHFGRMDDEKYMMRTQDKIRCYQKTGYKLGDGFIFTMESAGRPLSTKYIKKTIEQYLI